MHLSVILPAYNEGAHIYENLCRVGAALEGLDWEAVVVDDGSRDNTFIESERAAAMGYPIRVVRQEVNRGKGAALLHGFAFTRGDLVAFLDADLEIAPEYLLRLLQVMREINVDVVIGVKDPWRSGFPLTRRILSMVYRTLIRLLFDLPLTDTQTGIKLFKRQVLESVRPRLKVARFAFDVELLVAASRFGYRIAETPVQDIYSRQGHMGRVRLRHAVGMLADTLNIFYRASFWSWLEPGPMTRLWMIAFVVGIFLFGIGVGKLITPLVLQPPLRDIFYIVALQFLPTVLRDLLVSVVGALLTLVSLLQLNKSLLNAFARRDRGDLAGILKRR